jgi:uncharacterized GH25 family protein
MRTVALSALACLLLPSVYAHDTWLQPTQFSVKPGAIVSLEMTSAAGFVGPESAIKAWRISRAITVVGGERWLITDLKEQEKTLRLATRVAQAGVAIVCVDLKPRLLELEPGKIEEYFHEIHAGPELRALWETVPLPRRWRETYVKHSKTFVRVGEPAKNDRGWASPLGLVLEIVPDRDPTMLRAHEELSVRVFRSGVPFAGFSLGFVSAGEKREHVAVTDENGRARAVLDTTGPWMVHGTDLRRSSEPGVEWESDFVTMVVEAK